MVKQKIKLTGGKFPEVAFDAILKSMACTVIGKDNIPALCLDFENGYELAIFGVDKLNDAGEIPTFMKFGKFVESLINLNVDCYTDTDLTDGLQFMTEPDIVGCRLWLQPIPGKYIGDTEKKYTDWIITKIETPTKPAARPKTPKETKKTPDTSVPTVSLDDMVQRWIDILPEVLDIPKDTLGIINRLKIIIPNETTRKPYADSRVAVFKTLKASGNVVEKDGIWSCPA